MSSRNIPIPEELRQVLLAKGAFLSQAAEAYIKAEDELFETMSKVRAALNVPTDEFFAVDQEVTHFYPADYAEYMLDLFSLPEEATAQYAAEHSEDDGA